MRQRTPNKCVPGGGAALTSQWCWQRGAAEWSCARRSARDVRHALLAPRVTYHLVHRRVVLEVERLEPARREERSQSESTPFRNTQRNVGNKTEQDRARQNNLRKQNQHRNDAVHHSPTQPITAHHSPSPAASTAAPSSAPTRRPDGTAHTDLARCTLFWSAQKRGQQRRRTCCRARRGR
eukprot:2993582-Rhodomonas_salina.1